MCYEPFINKACGLNHEANGYHVYEERDCLHIKAILEIMIKYVRKCDASCKPLLSNQQTFGCLSICKWSKIDHWF